MGFEIMYNLFKFFYVIQLYEAVANLNKNAFNKKFKQN